MDGQVKYTEEDMRNALKLQKAEAYQIVGNILIKPSVTSKEVESVLDYLYSEDIISIEQVDNFLNEWEEELKNER